MQNLHLYTQKSVCVTSTRPFGEVGGNSPLQLSSRTHFAKIEDKSYCEKLSLKTLQLEFSFAGHLFVLKSNDNQHLLGPIAQSVASLTADPGVVGLIPVRSHTFVVIDHEIISYGHSPPSADSDQLQAKVCAQSTGQACPGKKSG